MLCTDIYASHIGICCLLKCTCVCIGPCVYACPCVRMSVRVWIRVCGCMIMCNSKLLKCQNKILISTHRINVY